MKLHELKTWPIYFVSMKQGSKPFDVRRNDRDFKVNDELLLKEFVPEYNIEQQKYIGGKYTGQIIHRRITYILEGGEFGIEKGFIVIGIAKI